jgi:competence ComEA-like helix-hairpin-helix protein
MGRGRTKNEVGALVLAGAILTAGMMSMEAAPQQPAEDGSAELYMRLCNTCHDAQRILANRRTRTQWAEVIEKMVERGAQGTPDELAAVEEYLLRVSGRVNVNRAVASDIAVVLGIPEKEAETIVAHRKANGDYPDFESLCKVPGIDVEKLKLARDAISF